MINLDLAQQVVGYRESTLNPRPWAAIAEHYRRGGLPIPEHGPWDTEPDETTWQDRVSGYQCWTKRGPGGAWNGYVNVPRGHPWHGLGYDDVGADLQVHGGLTFADSWLEEGDWWFGFDCGHAFDIQPGMPTHGEGRYRDLDYVQREVYLLALQLYGTAIALTPGEVL